MFTVSAFHHQESLSNGSFFLADINVSVNWMCLEIPRRPDYKIRLSFVPNKRHFKGTSLELSYTAVISLIKHRTSWFPHIDWARSKNLSLYKHYFIILEPFINHPNTSKRMNKVNYKTSLISQTATSELRGTTIVFTTVP